MQRKSDLLFGEFGLLHGKTPGLLGGSLLEISSSQWSKLLGKNQVSNRAELRLQTKSEPISCYQKQKEKLCFLDGNC